MLKKRDEFEEQRVANNPYLEFENFNFKLAVLEELIFVQEILPFKNKYSEELERLEACDYDEETYERDLERYIQKMQYVFEIMLIPSELAEQVETLSIEMDNIIYGQIYPYWDGEDNRFDIGDISLRELKQFPNLKEISIYYMTSDTKAIRKRIKKAGIRATITAYEPPRRVNPKKSVAAMAGIAILCGLVLAFLFHQRNGDEIWHLVEEDTITEENLTESMLLLEDPSSDVDTSSDKETVGDLYDFDKWLLEDQTEKLEHILNDDNSLETEVE